MDPDPENDTDPGPDPQHCEPGKLSKSVPELLMLFEALLHCALGLRLLLTVTLKSSLVSPSCLPLNTCGQDLVAYVHHFELTSVKLNCSKLMPSVSLFRQFCRASPSA
jgi:hypothetical protein